MSFLDKVKKASKGVIDAGAKTMLKVRSSCKYWFVERTTAARRTCSVYLLPFPSLSSLFAATD
jgi:hypothetical protein